MPKRHVPPDPKRVPGRPEPENRDPNDINGHLKDVDYKRSYVTTDNIPATSIVQNTFDYYHVFGEPSGIKSADCVWEFSRTFYDFFKALVYNLFSCLLGPFIAIWWGCEFALVAFQNIWCLTPCFKSVEISCVTCGRMLRSCLRCWIYPPCRAIGYIFIAFRQEGINDEEYDNPFYHVRPSPVKKTRIIQTPSRKNKVAPEGKKEASAPPSKAKKEKSEGKPHLVPAAAVVAVNVPDQGEDPEDYLGEKDKMVNFMKRQMQI